MARAGRFFAENDSSSCDPFFLSSFFCPSWGAEPSPPTLPSAADRGCLEGSTLLFPSEFFLLPDMNNEAGAADDGCKKRNPCVNLPLPMPTVWLVMAVKCGSSSPSCTGESSGASKVPKTRPNEFKSQGEALVS